MLLQPSNKVSQQARKVAQKSHNGLREQSRPLPKDLLALCGPCCELLSSSTLSRDIAPGPFGHHVPKLWKKCPSFSTAPHEGGPLRLHNQTASVPVVSRRPCPYRRPRTSAASLLAVYMRMAASAAPARFHHAVFRASVRQSPTGTPMLYRVRRFPRGPMHNREPAWGDMLRAIVPTSAKFGRPLPDCGRNLARVAQNLAEAEADLTRNAPKQVRLQPRLVEIDPPTLASIGMPGAQQVSKVAS